MSDPPSPRRARTRARIIAGAQPLFHERGLKKVTVEDVCFAAGVSRRTFYQHFESREALASEVIGIMVRDISGPLLINLESKRPAAEIISRNFDLVAELVSTRVSLRFLAEVEAELPEDSRLIKDARRRIVDGLVKVIHRGQREGSIQLGLQPASLGKIIYAILENSVSPAFALANDLGMAEICETLSALFLSGLFLSESAPASGRRRTQRKRQGAFNRNIAGGCK
jgi:TetR/AcrR family transcriptional regulator, transcriptional repressor for nem operon